MITTLALAAVVERLAAAAEPWKTLFSDSKPVADAVLFAHLGGIVVAAGFALATDRATLRVNAGNASARSRHLDELHAIHRPVLVALSIVVLSGILLFASDVETFATSLVYWTKMALVVLLLANGLVMTRSETALRRAVAGSASSDRESPEAAGLWRRVRLTAAVSGVLWMTIVLFGVIVANI